MPTTAPPKLVRVITRMNIGGPARHVTILTAHAAPEFDGVLLTGETSQREGSLEKEALAAGARVVHVPRLRRVERHREPPHARRSRPAPAPLGLATPYRAASAGRDW